MPERRREERIDVHMPGLFLQDGTSVRIRVCDKGDSGVGAYSAQAFRPGQQGLLLARMPESDRVEELPSEVCWCMSDPMAKNSLFPYRVGIRLLAS